MSLIAKESGVTFELLPSGMHHGVCYGVVDLGVQPSFNPKFPPRRKVRFLWEIPGERIDIEKDGVTKNLARAIGKGFTNSLSAKSNLRPMLESWRGRPFSAEELKGFDLKSVLAANCFLNVVHETSKEGKAFAEVKSVNPLPKGMAKAAPENPFLFFSLDEFVGREIVFPANMPDWLVDRVKLSEEYIARSQRRDPSAPPLTQPDADEEPGEDVPF